MNLEDLIYYYYYIIFEAHHMMSRGVSLSGCMYICNKWSLLNTQLNQRRQWCLLGFQAHPSHRSLSLSSMFIYPLSNIPHFLPYSFPLSSKIPKSFLRFILPTFPNAIPHPHPHFASPISNLFRVNSMFYFIHLLKQVITLYAIT